MMRKKLNRCFSYDLNNFYQSFLKQLKNLVNIVRILVRKNLFDHRTPKVSLVGVVLRGGS